MAMHIELTHDTQEGKEVYIFHKDNKGYILPKHLDMVNEALPKIPTSQRIEAMELAIKLERQAHDTTREQLDALQEELGVLNKNYQIAINTILAINEGASLRIINKLIGQLQKRKLVID